MSAHKALNWRDAIRERVRFYGGITVAIIIDMAFLLGQRALVVGEKWCVTRWQLDDSEMSLHYLQIMFGWGTFCIVAVYIAVDVYRTVRKLAQQ